MMNLSICASEKAKPSGRPRPLTVPATWVQAVSAALIPVLGVTMMPRFVGAQAPLPSGARTSQTVSQGVKDAKLAKLAQPDPMMAGVLPNRTLPEGARPEGEAAEMPLGSHPSDAEVTAARVFPEPLIASGGTAEENANLATALKAYAASKSPEDFGPLLSYLRTHPQSRWGTALWLNVGLLARHRSYFSVALNAWEEAWRLGKASPTAELRPLVDRAVAELAELNARLGRFERLTALFAELDAMKRVVGGAPGQKLVGARQGLWLMDHKPEDAFRCGPMALERIRVASGDQQPINEKVLRSKSTRQGMSLTQVEGLSREMGFPMRAARRGPGAEIVTPAVVHWKVGHYAALLEERNGAYRVEDPTFGEQFWVSRAALEAETSGYYLVAAKASLPKGWQAVGSVEGRRVWGKGNTQNSDPNRTSCTDAQAKDCPCCKGMPQYNMHTLLASLSLIDEPLSYQPPVGPEVAFVLHYAQREANQPATPTAWNVGRSWTCNWLSYVTDFGAVIWTGGTAPNWTVNYNTYGAQAPQIYVKGGGLENYTSSTIDGNIPVAQQTPARGVHWKSSVYGPRTAELVQTGPTRYEQRLLDGSVRIYAQPSTTAIYPREVFLSQEIDPSGNTMTYSYDSQSRLVAVTDSIGQVTTLSYELPGDPLRVTKVTDPWNRIARIGYDQPVGGRLNSLTDTAGMTSVMTYDAGTFVKSLATPYGMTTFAYGDVTTDASLGLMRWLEATDVNGDKERLEYRPNAPGIPFSLPFSEVPTSPAIGWFNQYIDARNSFFWDKKAYKEAQLRDGTLDYTKARLTHFLHDTDINVTSGIVESTKAPFEARVWYSYQGQPNAIQIGNGMRPVSALVARVIEDGNGGFATQATTTIYNASDRPISVTDPLGRRMTYSYYPLPGATTNLPTDPGIDLKEVRLTTPAMNGQPALNEFLGSFTYDGAHHLKTLTDASGQVTTRDYNTAGQLTRVTNARNEAVAYTYDGQGYLQTIVSPNPASFVQYGYDAFSRISAVTTFPDNDTVSIGYEAIGGDPRLTLDRPTTITYPDGRYTETVYTKLHTEWTRDPAGNWTHYLVNNLQQVSAVIDSLGQITQFGYCKCGKVQSIRDANGNLTTWTIDAQSRVTAKAYADGLGTQYAYEPRSGRLSSVTDALGQVTKMTYQLDGATTSVSYANAQIATPGVTWGYDPQRGRLMRMTDQFGATTYDYNPLFAAAPVPAVTGAGTRSANTISWANSTIVYGYDALGRRNGVSIGGVAQSWDWDAQGRLQTQTNSLGTFTYGYEGVTSRLASVAATTGPQTSIAYKDVDMMRHVGRITYTAPGGGNALLGQHEYDYDAAGNIKTWTMTRPGAGNPIQWAVEYDAIYQLAGVTQRDTVTATVQRDWAYRYDKTGNRISEQVDLGVTAAGYNGLNQLTSQTGGGPIRFAGTVSEPWSNVTVGGQAARVDRTSGRFSADLDLAPGSKTVPIVARDPSGNARTQNYQLNVPTLAVAAKIFSYDAEGQLLADSESTYEWDAMHRLVAIVRGTHRSEFGYDGAGRRVRIIEMENNVTVEYRRFIFAESSTPLEERGETADVVVRRYFYEGEQTNGGTGKHYYLRDHLGSVREIVGEDGGIQARYEYDPWGRQSTLSGTLTTSFGFTGNFHHLQTGLHLTQFRAYDERSGRWLSRDPSGERTDLNIYAAVSNNVLNFVDPYGLDRWINLPGGFTVRVDPFNNGAGYEIHVYGSGGGEVGVLGPEGWIYKHGHTKVPDLPAEVKEALNGVNVSEARAKNLCPPKGRANIKGWFKRLSRFGGRVAGAIVVYQMATAPSCADAADVFVDTYASPLPPSTRQEREQDPRYDPRTLVDLIFGR